MLLAILFGYLVGSISFSIIVTRLLKGVDIREFGSGNAGMTNVLRTLGKGPAAVVLVGDALKGIACVYFGFYLGDTTAAVAGGLAAMVGHTYPLYFGFRGGKGVATGFGVILALMPDVTIIALLVFILTVLVSRYVSLGSILAALSVAVSPVLLHKPLPILVFSLLAASLVIYRHRTNLVRLYHGKENRLGNKKGQEG